MNIVDDIRDMSDKALDKIAQTLGDLPKPVLAVIGAGDAAVDKVTDTLTALRRKEFMQDVERFFAELPGKAQQLFADLPAKAQEAANALGRDNLRATMDDARQTVTSTYRDLADRGGQAVARARAAGSDEAAAEAEADTTSEPKAAKKPAARSAKPKPDAKAGTKPKKVKSETVAKPAED